MRLVIVLLVAEVYESMVHDVPLTLRSIWYPVKVKPLVLVGAVQDKVACRFPRTANTLVGAAT